jgi:hypothetical protein
VANIKREKKRNAQNKMGSSPTVTKGASVSTSRKKIEQLRGRFKGKQLLKTLMTEKQTERDN